MLDCATISLLNYANPTPPTTDRNLSLVSDKLLSKEEAVNKYFKCLQVSGLEKDSFYLLVFVSYVSAK